MIATRNETLECDLRELHRWNMERGQNLVLPAKFNDKPYSRDGYHLSDSLYCTYKRYFRVVKGMDYGFDATTELKFLFGHAIQFFLFPQHQKYDKVYELDGIRGTPDFVDHTFMNYHTDLAELKVTWKSARNFNLKTKKQDSYKRQMMGYCQMVGISHCDFIGYFVNGDYSNGFKPQLRCWRCEFSAEELEDNWLEMLRRKEVNEKAARGNSLPELIYYDWECNICEYKEHFCPKWGGINGAT